jgi:two-component sensor histidine kinase
MKYKIVQDRIDQLFLVENTKRSANILIGLSYAVLVWTIVELVAYNSHVGNQEKDLLFFTHSTTALFSVFSSFVLTVIWRRIGLSFSHGGKFNPSLFWLSCSFLFWAIAANIRCHHLIYSFGQSEDTKNLMLQFMATLNSTCLLLAAIDFEFDEKQALWRYKRIVKIFQSTRNIFLVMGISLASTAFLFIGKLIINKNWNLGKDSYLLDIIQGIPDLLFSIPTIYIMGRSLFDLFGYRKFKEMKILVFIAYSIAMIAQIIANFPDEMIPIPKVYSEIIIYFYRFLVIAIFLVLVASWIMKNLIIRETTLRRAMNHAIRNNLQFIYHIIDKKIKSNDVSRDTLIGIQMQIRSTERVHDLLNRSSLDSNHVPLGRYFKNLTDELRLGLAYHREQFSINIDIPNNSEAVPKIANDLGFIITELIMNSHKHGSNNPDNTVQLSINTNKDSLNIVHRDNAGGMNKKTRTKDSSFGFGLEFIRGLVEEDFEGSLSYKPLDSGTEFLITIPINKIL